MFDLFHIENIKKLLTGFLGKSAPIEWICTRCRIQWKPMIPGSSNKNVTSGLSCSKRDTENRMYTIVVHEKNENDERRTFLESLSIFEGCYAIVILITF